jgi:hypothetical protein
VILHCNFEELRALSAAIELMATEAGRYGAAVSAPPEGVAKVEQLLPRLTGDVSIETLDDQRRVREAVGILVADLHRRMDDKVLEFHPAHEEAVALYFDYAHGRTVLHRLDRMGAQMEAIIDLISGDRSAAGLSFPD